MKEKDLPDFDFNKDPESPRCSKGPSDMTETIDAQNLWPSGATISGSFDLTELKASSLGKLLNALPTPAVIIDRSAGITFANTASGEVAGSVEALRGCRFIDCLEPENPSALDSLIEEVFTDRKPRVLETMLKTAGRTIWGRVHLRSIRFGKEQGALILVEDLTTEKRQLIREQKHRDELKKAHGQLEKRVRERTADILLANAQLKEEIAQRARAEQSLIKEKEFSSTALDTLPGIFYFCDDSGRLIRWNKNLERALGYSAKEISQKNVLDFFSDRSRPAVKKGIRHIVLKGEHSGEARIRSRDGREIPYLLTGVRITVNGRQCFLGTGIDISQRESTEQALRASEERMRLAIEASPIGIAIVQDGTYIYANPALAMTFGYDSPHAMEGLYVHDLFADTDRVLVEEQARGRLPDGASSPALEVKGRRRNGESFDASIWVTAIDFQGRLSLLEFIIDMSQEKALRTQLFQAQKMEAIGTLAGGMAHDFNNLLTIIQGFAELVFMEQKEGEPSYGDLQQVIRAARNGADLVRRILTFSSHVEPQLRSIDLNHEVRQAEKLLRRTIPKMIEIELRLEEPLGEINGDPGQIEQVLLNLAVNAQHAMPESGKLVIETKNLVLDESHCRGHIDVNPGPHVLLSVTDNGHGMSKEVVDHVFEPFFTTKKPGEGTGLGLAMVFGIVKCHGGTITCRSQPGLGAAFEMCFPANATPGKAGEKTAESSPAHGTETILLVDDEEPIRDLATRVLTRAGYQVMSASEGSRALEIYRGKQDQISLILLDVIMPGMSGTQCLEKLLEIDPNVKVLVTSGFPLDASTKSVIERGSKGFVTKPFNTAQVLATIRSILDKTDS